MTSLLSVILFGFVLGMRHAIDPDHVIAVATIGSQQRSIAGGALIGVLWGIGHTVTIVTVGIAIIAFNVVISPEIGHSLELVVALMLILLGVLSLRGATRPTSEGARAPGDDPRHDFSVGRLLRPLVIGIVHGLAGSASIALLVLAPIRDPLWAATYLLVFGFGTIAGMMLITGLMVWPFAHIGHRSATIRRRLTTATGVLSVAFGVFLAYQIGIVGSVFAGHAW
jgi:ABC-type nickel/cobalt efflux system permease component RcnA